jgi:histidinol-phosphatase
VALDADLQLWDYAAVQLLVEEAGGRCSTFAGDPPRPKAFFVSSNGILHNDAVTALT